MNNFTAMIAIDDRQGGGDNYAFEVTWHADAAFFDYVRACQDAVRQRVQSQNGRRTYIDFQSFANRLDERQGRGAGRNRGQEAIQGKGNARGPNESRELTYSCTVDTRRNQVLTGTYNYTGSVLRGNERGNYGRPLR